MPALPAVVHDTTTLAAVLAAGGCLIYLTLISAVALVSVFARTPARRRDARSTLTILTKLRPPR